MALEANHAPNKEEDSQVVDKIIYSTEVNSGNGEANVSNETKNLAISQIAGRGDEDEEANHDSHLDHQFKFNQPPEDPLMEKSSSLRSITANDHESHKMTSTAGSTCSGSGSGSASGKPSNVDALMVPTGSGEMEHLIIPDPSWQPTTSSGGEVNSNNSPSSTRLPNRPMFWSRTSSRYIPLEELQCLSEDIFSLAYTSAWGSQAMLFAGFVFSFQMFIIFLILFNLLDLHNALNPLQVPPGVEWEVSIAQAAAMILAVATQGDMILAVTMLLDSHDKDNKDLNPNASTLKWRLSGAARFLSGAFTLLDVYILLMQSRQVIELMMNFAALQFAAEIDNVAFVLAKKGFVTNRVQKHALQVGEMRVHRDRKKFAVTRRILYFLVTGGLLAGYSGIVFEQRSGKFLCNTVFTQFGDAFNPFLSYYSGQYTQQHDVMIGHRVVYVDKRKQATRYAYCLKEKAWTFSFVSTGDPCEYLVKSAPTATFDIIETSHQPWYVRDVFQTNQTHEIDHFKLHCNDCNPEICQPSNGRCDEDENECKCHENRFGLNCEFQSPCPRLDLDMRTNQFPVEDGGNFKHTSEFELLLDYNNKPVEVYNRPVYYFQGDKNHLSILIFLGRRWVLTLGETLGLTRKELLDGMFNNATDMSDVRPYLTANFHGLFSGYRASFMSDPSDVGKDSDKITPAGKQWHRARYVTDWSAYWADETQTVGTVLLCPECNLELNDCFNFGTCNSEGTCDCFTGYEGFLCEYEHKCNKGMHCLNGGKCVNTTGLCTCPVGFYGGLCQFGGV